MSSVEPGNEHSTDPGTDLELQQRAFAVASETGPMSPHIEEVLLDGSYEVLEEITP